MLPPIENAETIDGPWELPEGWKWKRLSSALSLKYGKQLTAGERDANGDYLVFGAGATGPIGRHSIAIAQNAPVIVIGRKGTLGSLFFSPDPCWPINTTIFTDEIAENINPKYIYHFLKVLDLKKLERPGSRPGLATKEILASPVPIPFPENPSRSLTLQNNVVNYLEAIEKDLTECRQEITAMQNDLNLLMSAEFKQIFGNRRDGFRIKNVPPEQVKQIREEDRQRGRFNARPRTDPSFFGGDIPWIQIHNLPDNNSKYITSCTKKLSEAGLQESRLFPKGTLVISIAATIGKMGILAFDACFPDSLVALMPDRTDVNVGFLYWQFLFLREFLQQGAPGINQKNINYPVLQEIELWMPPLETQKAIDTHLDEVHKDIEEMQITIQNDTEALSQLEINTRKQAFQRNS
jgi:type I restriction enzyme S subunit